MLVCIIVARLEVSEEVAGVARACSGRAVRRAHVCVCVRVCIVCVCAHAHAYSELPRFAEFGWERTAECVCVATRQMWLCQPELHPNKCTSAQHEFHPQRQLHKRPSCIQTHACARVCVATWPCRPAPYIHIYIYIYIYNIRKEYIYIYIYIFI